MKFTYKYFMFIRGIKILIILISLAHPVFANTAIDRAIREVDQPPLKITPEIPSPQPAVEFKAPEVDDADDEKFLIKEIIVSGVESLDPKIIREIVSPFEGQSLSFKRIKAIARQIEQAYLKHDMIAACLVPPQKMEDNILRLQVVESKMGDLLIEDAKYFSKNRLKKFWIPKPGKVLNHKEILRSLYTMNKNPDQKIKATMIAGKTPQTTDIRLDPQTKFPLHPIANFDREGTPATGEARLTLGFRHNNFLGLNDSLLYARTFGKNFTSISTSHNVPLNKWGTSLVAGYSYSKSFPKGDFESLLVDARSRGFTIGLQQDLFDAKGQYIGYLGLDFDANNKSSSTVAGTLNADRLRVLRLKSFNYVRFKKLMFLINQELSQGINGFGARRQNDFSSRGAKNTFTKYSLGFRNQFPIFKKIQLNWRTNSMIASNKLTPQEQMYLGGINSVRGYPSGDFSADDGIESSVELVMPSYYIPKFVPTPFSKDPLQETLQTVIFWDYGWGNKRHHTSTEQNTANMMSAGAGLRFNIRDNVSVRMEWGAIIGDAALTEQGKTQFHFSIDSSF